MFHRFDPLCNRLDQIQKFLVDQHHIVCCVVHRVQNLLRGQTDIDRMQHRPNHRNRKEALEVTVTVPVKYCHGVPFAYTQGLQCISEPRNTLREITVTVSIPVPVDDLLFGVSDLQRGEQLLDQQWIVVGRRSAGDIVVCHEAAP